MYQNAGHPDVSGYTIWTIVALAVITAAGGMAVAATGAGTIAAKDVTAMTGRIGKASGQAR